MMDIGSDKLPCQDPSVTGLHSHNIYNALLPNDIGQTAVTLFTKALQI